MRFSIIRLLMKSVYQNAMEEDLLCPFHYFGITDLEIISDCGKSSEEKMENFRYLASDTRVLNVMKQAEFSDTVENVSKDLFSVVALMKQKNYPSNSTKRGGGRLFSFEATQKSMRKFETVDALQGDDSKDALDYIISVDIFSEGVDAPEINQVIMLRQQNHQLYLSSS